VLTCLPQLGHHDDSPPPVSTTVRKAAADFKRFHQDTWEQDAPLFGDRLSEVSEWARGSSSYFA
jgi:proteasome activator subunit 4